MQLEGLHDLPTCSMAYTTACPSLLYIILIILAKGLNYGVSHYTISSRLLLLSLKMGNERCLFLSPNLASCHDVTEVIFTLGFEQELKKSSSVQNESVTLQRSKNTQCVLCRSKRELVTAKETYKLNLCFVMV
jgi:hypothetical protein